MHHTSPLINFQGNSAGRAQNFYSKKLIKLAEDIALENGIDVQKGVYLVVQGPNLETVAEYRMTRKLGGDVVGMSTVPEVLAAAELGVECLGLSIITDEGFPDTFKIPVSDTRAYKQFGNSVVVPVMEAVARAMKSCIAQAVKKDRPSLKRAA